MNWYNFYKEMSRALLSWVEKHHPEVHQEYLRYIPDTLSEVYFMDLPSWLFRFHGNVLQDFLSTVSESLT